MAVCGIRKLSVIFNADMKAMRPRKEIVNVEGNILGSKFIALNVETPEITNMGQNNDEYNGDSN